MLLLPLLPLLPLLQGITFGVGFSTATVYSGKLAPPQLAATFQVGNETVTGCCYFVNCYAWKPVTE
jgi:hypothetical protein